MRTSLALAIGFLVAGCSHQPQARNVTGPDGSPMVHVSCSSDQSACFELAGRNCPTGYELFPIFDARDNNFLVRCRQGAPQLPIASFATPAVKQAPAPVLAAPLPRPPASATAVEPSSANVTAFSTAGGANVDWGY
ncbi:MAG: hypothetical protein QM756_17845 [Polyangiaceae bacterium]